MLLLCCKGEPLSLIAVHQQFAEPCHQSILRAPRTDFHVTSVSCEPAALSRPAADGGAKACRQSASHSLAAREPGITVRRLQVAPAHEREAAGDSSRRARFASTAADNCGSAKVTSPQRISHWPTRFFARWLGLPSLAMPAADVSDRCCPLLVFGFLSL